MKKRNDQKSKGNKLKSPAATGSRATSLRPVHREPGASNISSDLAFEQIRARAYHLFQSRGQQPGQELDDWLQAERELLRPFRSL